MGEEEQSTIYVNAKDMLISGWSSPGITIDSTAFTMRNPWEDKLKEYCSSTDKHLDELEEDIEFLDNMRKDTNDQLAFHNDKIGELEAKIKSLQDENVQLHDDLDNLYNQIYILQQKLDNQ